MSKRKNFLNQVFGRFSWDRPAWALDLQAKTRTREFWIGLLASLLFLVVALFILRWYLHLPKPTLVTAHIAAPVVTPIDEEPNPQPLTINFGTEQGKDAFIPASVAPLNQANQEIKEGIAISPAIKGKWYWIGSDQINFKPDEPWLAGTQYQIKFSKPLLAKQIKLQQWNYEFETAPFEVDITEFKFYQDPKDPTIKQAVATLVFNYPVNTQSLLDHLSLKEPSLTGIGKQYKVTVDFDKAHRTAYVHSEILNLQTNPFYLELKIAKGVEPAAGNATAVLASKKTLIPSQSTIFNIKDVAAVIARDELNNPSQVLAVETSLGVIGQDLSKAVQVYQLPQDKPAQNTEAIKKDYEWVNPGEVDETILKQSKRVPLEPIPAADQYSPFHSFRFNVPANSYLYVKVDRSLRGLGDFSLSQNYTKILAAPKYPQEVNFLHNGSLLALSSEKKISLIVRGIPAIHIEVDRVLPDDLNHLITQTEGKFNSPYFMSPRFNQNNISKVFSEIREFNTADPSKPAYTALDLDRYLTDLSSQKKLGLFLLTIREWDNTTKTAGDIIKARRLVLITDLGLITKFNADQSQDVFVQSITSGDPVANAQVSILGKNGLPLLTEKTDSGGHVHFPDLKDFTQDREPTVYVVQNNGDVSFIPYEERDRSLNFSRFDVGGVYQTELQNNLTAYLFSDRGIYRPGDIIHAGIIVKQAYAQQAPAGLPLEATITDPRGQTVFDQKISLPAANFFAVDYTPSEAAPTGTYSVNLYTVKEGKLSDLLGSTNVQVQEFLPDRMKISAQLTPPVQAGWIFPNDIKAQVNLKNLFGTPAQHRRATAKIVLSPEALKFDAYKNFVFTDPLQDPKKPVKKIEETLPETTTDDQGNAFFSLDLTRYNQATYQLSFFAEGFEADSGRSVATQINTLVTPLPFLLGYQQDKDLQFLKQNSPHELKFLAIDQQLKPTSVALLHAKVFLQQKIVTLVKNPDGTYVYQKVIQEKPLTDNIVSIPVKGFSLALNTSEIGDYVLELTDVKGVVVSKIKYSIVGEGRTAEQRQTELTVKLNKEEYKAGENIEMEIGSPYAGAGLITIERDKTYSFKWFKTSDTNSIQSITIPPDFQGDGYINIAMVRSWNSEDIFSNPLSYAVIPFSVNRAAHTVNIQLSAPELAQPGSNLPITYSTDQPAKIVIFGVDEGILQVANYQAPDPLGYFFRKHALEVATRQIVDQILPNYLKNRELSAAGGDGGEEKLLAANLNPFKRKNKLPVVFWSGIVDAGTHPQQLNYLVPDYFNGSLKWMAVAVAANAVGSTETVTPVRGDFVINANVPLFVAPGDTFDVSVDVANNLKDSGKALPVNLNLEVDSGLAIQGKTSQTLKIDENGETTAHFQLTALNTLGNLTLRFSTSAKDKTSQMSESLSVRPAIPYATQVLSGYNNTSSQTLVLPQLRPEFFKGFADMSVSPLILANGLQRYLDNFPFSCTEQLVSKAFMGLVMAEQPSFIADKNAADEKIQLAINILRQRQMESGAFSYWPGLGENSSNKFATIYAMQFLTEARERGYQVPSDLFQQGINYLQSIVANDPESFEDARNLAYAIYLLTRNEIVTTNYLTNLQLYLEKNYAQQWPADIIGSYLAASYQMLKDKPTAARLIKQYHYGAKPEDNYSDFYNNLANDAQYLTIVSRYFPEQLTKLGAGALVPLTHAIMQNDFNTVSAAYSALALSTYGKNLQAAPIQQTIIEIINNTKKVLAQDNSTFLRAIIDKQAEKLIFNTNARQGFFYQASLSGFATVLPQVAAQNGLEIYRDYRDSAGKNISTANIGNEIEVHLQVRSLNNRELNNIAIIDLLPGGFEVVRDSLKQENVDYVDAREDRVIFFTRVGPDSKEIVYRIKPTNKGSYIIPPVFATAMYDPAIKANGVAGSITVQ